VAVPDVMNLFTVSDVVAAVKLYVPVIDAVVNWQDEPMPVVVAVRDTLQFAQAKAEEAETIAANAIADVEINVFIVYSFQEYKFTSR